MLFYINLELINLNINTFVSCILNNRLSRLLIYYKVKLSFDETNLANSLKFVSTLGEICSVDGPNRKK